MNMTLLLPWFPILLGAGVGGRLLGRQRGLALGFVCAMFWIVLIQAQAGVQVWQSPWIVVSIVAGATAICAIGGWSGGWSSKVAGGGPTDGAIGQEYPARNNDASIDPYACFNDSSDRFDAWLAEHREDSNPWPYFDEFVRTALYDCCKATHVKPYRLCSGGEHMAPLTESDDFADFERPSARKGIVGHVVTTGRAYVAGDPSQGELVEQLARDDGETSCWCFSIRQGTDTLGVVSVGQIDLSPQRYRYVLRATQRQIGHFWCLLYEACRSRSAVLNDPVSGLLMREAYLRVAQQSLHESYSQGEPVAVVVVALEGLRSLNDSGRWELADELVSEVSRELKRKVRLDDRIGRFDGSRFALLLRRVDSELASLIVAQVTSRLQRICSDEARWQVSIQVRCGVAGSGVEEQDLRALLSRALQQCHRARFSDQKVVSDLMTDTPAERVLP